MDEESANKDMRSKISLPSKESLELPSAGSVDRRGFIKGMTGTAAGAAVLAGLGTAQHNGGNGDAGPSSHNSNAGAGDDSGEEYLLESTPENVDWGYFDPDREPVLEVESGDTVTMEGITVMVQGEEHAEFLMDKGIPESHILEDEVAIGQEVEPGPGHIVTGPVYIDDAEPGDILQVDVLDVEVRTQYGLMYGGPGGALPNDFSEGETHVIPFDEDKEHALFTEDVDVSFDQDIQIPLDPFLGIHAVSPRPSEGAIDTIPPSYYGGNMDLRQLTAGSTIYLPVSAEGALFWIGDGHAVQGDAEVSLTGMETSLTGTFQFTLHKDFELDWPVAENGDYYMPMGFNEDLDVAMEGAVREAISLLHHLEGLDPLDAYRLCSLNVDFRIAEVVDDMEIVYAMIPKSLFPEGGTITPEGLTEGF